jgi:TDG/mug DNA glycosylase family protein
MAELPPRRPTPAEVQAARGKTIRDVIRKDLDVLFCGINPGLYTAATGHHFARPGNRFWPALHHAGFTTRRLFPWEQTDLLEIGCGATNLVARATATAAELDDGELRAGRRRLERKVRQYRPRIVAIVGLGAFRVAFSRPQAVLGLQPETIAGARLWVLPNTSGLNANHQAKDFAKAFGALRAFASQSLSRAKGRGQRQTLDLVTSHPPLTSAL